MEQRSLNMQLPRGWYQVAGLHPHTFRRHCSSSKSGSLQVSLLPAPEVPPADGEEAQAMLKATLAQQDVHVGHPLKTGCEECAAGILAYAVYKHIGGQREYWLIPSEDATVFACWEMGAMATAGMERQAVHEMLKALYFESGGVEAGETMDDAMEEAG